MNGFLRGGTGFLKGTGEIIKGNTGSHREVRVGVTYASILIIILLNIYYVSNYLCNVYRPM